VFDEWRLPAENYVTYARFSELMMFWGFVASDDQIQLLFIWMDRDQDGKLSFEDMKETIGLDVSPKEAVYFRQNVNNSKS